MKLRRLALDAFKQAAKSGENLEEVAVIRDLPSAEVKALGVEPGQEAEARVFEFTISTESPDDDRSNDFISSEGWKLDRYRKNPVVLFGHRSDELPVGTSPAVWPEVGKLRAKADFTQTYDVSPMARMVCQLVGRKVLNAASVGFLPLVYAFNEKRSGFAMDFLEQELLEWSVVPVPANAEALQGAKSAGVDLAPLGEWAEKVLDGERGPGLWVPKSLVTDDLIARARAIAKGAPVSVSVPEKLEPTTAETDQPTGESIADAVKGALAAFEKAGRVLSAANEGALREAADSIQAAADRIEGVLAKLEPVDDGKSAPPAKSGPAEVTFLLDVAEPEALALSDADLAELKASIEQSIHQALTLPLTGRLD